MSNGRDWFKQFIEIAKPNLERRCAALISTLTYQARYLSAEPEWHGVSTRIILVPFTTVSGPVGPRIFESATFRASRGLVSPEKVGRLLESLGNGVVLPDALPVGWSQAVHLSPNTPTQFHQPRFFEADSLRVPLAWRVPGYETSAIGVRDGDFDRGIVHALEALERQLPAFDPPFGGIRGLAEEIGLAHAPGPGVATSVVEVIAPLWLTLDDLQRDVREGRLRIKVKSYWTDVGGEASVSIISRGDPHKTRLPLGEAPWNVGSDSEGARVYTADVRVPDGSVSVHLNYGPENIATILSGVASTPALAHELADPGFAILRSFLLGPVHRKGDNFEVGVAWLLHLAGFRSVRYGLKRLQRAVDVVAYLDDFNLVYGECSVEPPDPDKLSDVASRASALTELATSRGRRPITVLPTIFTAAPSGPLVRERPYPEVLILAREDIEDLLERALRGESAARFYEDLVARRQSQIVMAQLTS